MSQNHRDVFFAESDPTFVFGRFLQQVNISLKDRKLILLLDEFEVLENQVKNGNLEPEIFEYLRSLMQKGYPIRFLLSGTHQIHELTLSYWSVFFNIALHYRLPSRISARGAEALITEPVANLEYEPLAVKKIRLLTADQPYLINLVCHELVVHCNKMQKNYVTINDVNLVLRSVLETGTIHFDWLWKDKLTKKMYQLVLLIIAEGSKDESRQFDLDDIRAIYQSHHLDYHQDEIAHALNTLVAEDVIETNGVERHETVIENARYSLTNGLLRQWLRRTKSLRSFLLLPEVSAIIRVSEQEQSVELAENQSNGSYDPDLVPATLLRFSEIEKPY